MRAESILSPAARLLNGHRTFILTLLVLSTYAVAIPPSETFGSHRLEQVKDVLALGLVAAGLMMRFVASGLCLERRQLQSPFLAANLLLLFGIVLMHGNSYVVVIGPLACVALYLLLRHASAAPGRMSWHSAFRGGERLRLGAALAREWPIATATVCLLVLTEAYEDLGGGDATAPHLLIFRLSGVALLVGSVAFGVQVRREMTLAGARGGAQKSPLHLSKRSVDALLLPSARLFLWLAALVLQLRRPYHSPTIAGGRDGKRENETRWSAVASVIRDSEARSILDVGCAEGWFLRRAADTFNCFGLGVDSRESRVMLGEAARLHGGDDRVAIMKGKLMPDDIRALPRFDVVMCLSVLHWTIRSHGLSEAQEFVRALFGRARKVLLFEIGDAERFAQEFSALLPASASGEDFVRHLLGAAGASNIRVIASSLDIKDRKERLLFAAEVPPDDPSEVR